MKNQFKLICFLSTAVLLVLSVTNCKTSESDTEFFSAFKLSTAEYTEQQDIESIARDLYGNKATLADWEKIKSYVGDDMDKLYEFYQYIGLRDQEEAMVSRSGKRFYSLDRQYYVHRFENGPYDGFFVHDQIGSLYLGSWHNLYMKILVDVE